MTAPTGSPTIGLIGLGVMGSPMAANLLEAGYPVVVHSRRSESAAPLVARGAIAAASPAAVARRAQVIITVVPDDRAVEQVVTGADGVLTTASAGTTIVDMSTISPATARSIARKAEEHGVSFLDAPVSGGERAAIEGSLSVMIGGDPERVEAVRPILGVLASRLVHIGGPGSGQIAKAANQVVVGLTIQAVAEGLTLAARAGADPVRVREALLGGFAASTVLEQHGARMLSGDFTSGGRIALHLKDLRIAVDLAAEVGSHVLATAELTQVMERLVSDGHAGLDQSAVLLAYEERPLSESQASHSV